MTTRRSRRRLGKRELGRREPIEAGGGGEVRGDSGQSASLPASVSAPGVVTYSRRHIDLQRVAGALCPGAPTVRPPRTAG
ncbi:putative leader peptide [Actinacidiphila reveromycinica]|uniref:putative leader peptide n=1 Tax=Actinacidiphila reveromycinica TaxID=659352 RepID=UPI003D2C8CC1